MKSPAWILLPSLLILVFTTIIIIPGIGSSNLKNVYVHKLTLSSEAQDYVYDQTGSSAESYIVHLWSTCTVSSQNSSYSCPKKLSPLHFFNFTRVLGYPASITELPTNSTERATNIAYLDSQVRKFKIYSHLYTLLTLMMVLSRLTVISLIIPLRLAHMRISSSYSFSQGGHLVIRTSFFVLRGFFSLAYIVTFVTANVLCAIALLLYSFRFYRSFYNSNPGTAVEQALGPVVTTFNFFIMFFTYLELYPAIAYMYKRPSVSSKRLPKLREIYSEDTLQGDLSKDTMLSSTTVYDKEKDTEMMSVHSTPSLQTCVTATPTTHTTDSSAVSELPSLVLSSDSPSSISEVSTTQLDNQSGSNSLVISFR